MESSQTQNGSSGTKPTMSLTDARAFLETCSRNDLVDHEFGDAEVGWYDAAGREVAGAYFGHESKVGINETERFTATTFANDEARGLRYAGTLKNYTRNDGDIPSDPKKPAFSGFGTIGDLLRAQLARPA